MGSEFRQYSCFVDKVACFFRGYSNTYTFFLLLPYSLLLQLARTMSGSKGDSLELAPPPPTELSLPQLCLAVSAKELVVAGRGMKGKKSEDVDQSGDRKPGSSAEEGKGGEQGEGEGGMELFRRREPLPYFTVDCRPKEQARE